MPHAGAAMAAHDSRDANRLAQLLTEARNAQEEPVQLAA